MHIAAIIGAGASVAEATSHRPQRTREHPPLDTNFFSKAAELNQPLRASLITSCRVIGLPNPFEHPEVRMEEVFGDIYFEVVESDGDRQELALEAYRTLLRLYGGVLAQTTNWMWDRPLGAIGRLLRALIQTPGITRLTLITFNHDLLLENALVQLPHQHRWCVDVGYGPIDLAPAETNRAVARLPLHSEACDHSIAIELLKLHGSLNWQVMTRSHDPSYRDLFPTTEAVPQIECITDRVVSTTLARKRGNRRWRLWPQIVPPIYQKLDIVSARFGTLWRHAGASLAAADRVMMIGYSMPAADAHSANLIRRAVRQNQNLDRIEVVNPDSGIVAKVASLGDIASVAWHHELSVYTDSLAV